MMKLPKPTSIILFILFVITVQTFVMEPYIERRYFGDAVDDFKHSSWMYTVGIVAVMAIFVALFEIRNKKWDTKKRLLVVYCLILFGFFLKPIAAKALLIANTKISVARLERTYRVVFTKPPLLYNDTQKHGLTSAEEVEKIAQSRKLTNRKPLTALQRNDTVKVVYNVGFLGVPFLR